MTALRRTLVVCASVAALFLGLASPALADARDGGVNPTGGVWPISHDPISHDAVSHDATR